VEAADLRRAMVQVLAAVRAEPELALSVAAPRVNIRQKIAVIFDALRRHGRMDFRDLLRRSRSRLEVVVSFLAVLELIKQRQVLARQENLFEPIEITPGAEWKPDQEVELELEFDE
jgi:segregation and condensation protein A